MKLALTFPTQVRIAFFFGVLLLIGVFFFIKQNQNPKRGGAISRPKMLWLVYALALWFVLTPILAFEPNFPLLFRKIFGGFSVLMWGRGVVELFMLYITKNWKPPLGIAHNIFCLVFLVSALFFYRFQIEIEEPFHWWGVSFVGVLFFSLVVETLYAILFNKVVAGKTTGEEGVWFASEKDDRFAKINQLTAFLNFPLYSYLLFFLAVSYNVF